MVVAFLVVATGFVVAPAPAVVVVAARVVVAVVVVTTLPSPTPESAPSESPTGATVITSSFAPSVYMHLSPEHRIMQVITDYLEVTYRR